MKIPSLAEIENLFNEYCNSYYPVISILSERKNMETWEYGCSKMLIDSEKRVIIQKEASNIGTEHQLCHQTFPEITPHDKPCIVNTDTYIVKCSKCHKLRAIGGEFVSMYEIDEVDFLIYQSLLLKNLVFYTICQHCTEIKPIDTTNMIIS